MRIFLDVGAHYGETLKVALHPRWCFDQIFLFEPAKVCQSILTRFTDSRLKLVPAGLSNKSGEATLYGPGLLGASVYQDKRQFVPHHISTETIKLIRASDWLRSSIPTDAEVYLKLNCEGSECDVLIDLLNAGAIHQIKSIYVDFDVRKVTSQAHKQEFVERRLTDLRLSYFTPESLGCRGNVAVEKWLYATCPRVRPSLYALFRYSLRQYAPSYIIARDLIGLVLPTRMYWWIGHRFGPIGRTKKH
jgi:FkbM family methyltransferase